MNAKIIISNLGASEKAAREILEHVEAIKKLQRDAAWNAAKVEIVLKEEAASGN